MMEGIESTEQQVIVEPSPIESGNLHLHLETSAATPIDPRIDRLIALRDAGFTVPATASTVPGEVAIVAEVTDVDAWEALSEVRPGVRIFEDNGYAIVTARVPLARIEVVKSQTFVRTLKAGRPLAPALSSGVQDARARPQDLRPDCVAPGGRGVVVGVIDFGCDFVHRNFRLADGRTRIEMIWNQGGSCGGTGPYDYGCFHSRAQIDAALSNADPYKALGYGPRPDTPTSIGSHGTHVLDIAAGNGRGSGTAGFAPEADIIFVDVATTDVPWSGPEVLDYSFGDSVRLLEAVRFIFDTAGDRPCVINISLGTNGGPHDGTTLVERGIDGMLRSRPNRAVVIAASNSYGDNVHAAGQVAVGGAADLPWRRPRSVGWHDELEVWYGAGGMLAAELVDPKGASLGIVEFGQRGEARVGNRVGVLISPRVGDPDNGDNMIGIYIDDAMPSGNWTLRLHNRGVQPVDYHAWIERDDSSQAGFLTPDLNFTIGSIACGNETFVVGSFDAHKPARPLSWFSSAGPTRDGREKPELSAPGHDVLAAHSRTVQGVTRKSGTSMAAPAVTGALALLLGEAAGRGIALDVGAIRAHLVGALRGSSVWDSRAGFGALDAAALLLRL